MPRPSFTGLSKSKNGSWKVHYQQHHPTLKIGIQSKSGKYFSIKQQDDGSLSVKYYNNILTMGEKSYAYAEVLPEICPEFHGNECTAHAELAVF
jgi:hypothetical protein